MRLSKFELGAILKGIRLAPQRKMTQAAFVYNFGTYIGIADDTAMSRYERGDRSLSKEQLQRIVDLFPQESEAISRHLLSIRPLVLMSKRLTQIETLSDGSFNVRTTAETHESCDYYVHGWTQRNDDLYRIVESMPRLNGISQVSPETDLIRDFDTLVQFEPPTYTVMQGGLTRKTYELRLRRLDTAEVLELAPDLPSDIAERAVFVGSSLEGPAGSLKRFYFDSAEKRRATMYNYRWRSMRPINEIEHRVRFTTLDKSRLDSFSVQPFLPYPDVNVTRTKNSVTYILRADAALDIGHGWIAQWRNPQQ